MARPMHLVPSKRHWAGILIVALVAVLVPISAGPASAAKPTTTRIPMPESAAPTAEPTPQPTPTNGSTLDAAPTNGSSPTPQPMAPDQVGPTPEASPTDEPTPDPTHEPTPEASPTDEPTLDAIPSDEPTRDPTPTDEPTLDAMPSDEPTPDPIPAPEPTPAPQIAPAPEPTPAPQPAPAPAPDVDSTAPVARTSATTARISPNGDGIVDEVTIVGTLSEPTDWDLRIMPLAATSDASVRHEPEPLVEAFGQRDLSLSVTWDGHGPSGSVVRDGLYHWVLTGVDAAGNEMDPLTGSVVVDRTAPVLTAIKALPSPVRRRASSPARIRFTPVEELSGPVHVRISVRKKGRVVQRLGEVTAADGDVAKIVWDLRNKRGRKVNAGRYRIVIEATDLVGNTVENRALALRVTR